MFKIRKEQSDVFRERAVKQSRARIAKQLRVKLPSDTARYSEEDLNRLVDRGIDKADSYGMGSEQGTFVYCAAAVVYGEDFDTSQPWSREVLPDRKIDQDLKYRLLAMRIAGDTGKVV